MTIDANKTPLTHRVTAVAAAYLDGIGCKPVETEVSIRADWIADVASYWYPTATETKKLFSPKRVREMLGESDLRCVRDMAVRVFGETMPISVLVEVKTTKADFVRDQRKWGQFPAHVCMVAFPCNLIEPAEIPKDWFGLETSQDGRTLRKVHRFGTVHPQHHGLLLDFIAQVGIRRDHRTRYRALRDWNKVYRVKDNERQVKYSAARLLEGLANWLQHKGWNSERRLHDVLPELGVKKIPEYLGVALEYLESLRKEGSTTESAEKKE